MAWRQQIIADFYATVSTQLLSTALIITVIERLSHQRSQRKQQIEHIVTRLTADRATALHFDNVAPAP